MSESARNKQLEDLDSLVMLTELMLTKAKAGEWDGIDEMEQQRFAFLQEVLGPLPATGESPEVAARLQRILELDKELMALAIAERDESAAQLQQLRQSSRAQAAYSSNQFP